MRASWLRDEHGSPTQALEHICWDGCMFPNAVMTAAADLAPDAWHHDRGAGCARGVNNAIR